MATESFTDNIVIKDKKACEKLILSILNPASFPVMKKEFKYSVIEESKKNAHKWIKKNSK